jgi:hypothetical protein
MSFVRGRSVLLWLSLAAALATASTVVLFIFERSHGWAHDWLPNLAAEWTGIVIAVGIFDAIRERQRENELKPLRARCYTLVKRDLDLIADNASSYLERFLDEPMGPAAPSDPIQAVRAIDDAYMSGGVRFESTRGSWWKMLTHTADRLDKTCEIYQPFLPPQVIVPLYAFVEHLESAARDFAFLVDSPTAVGNYRRLAATYEPAYQAITNGLAKSSPRRP